MRTDTVDGELGRGLAIGQGAWYAVAGAWPLLHERSFEAVTGPKRERWLVKTVGVLVAAIGGALLLAGARRAMTPEVVLLAAGSAAGLAAIEAWYAGPRRRIAPVYLADAAVEAAIVAAWGAIALHASRLRRAQDEAEGARYGRGGEP